MKLTSPMFDVYNDTKRLHIVLGYGQVDILQDLLHLT